VLDEAMRLGRPGPYQIQAAISALHSQAPSWERTDWRQIAALYDALLRHDASPVVELNRAVAVSMASGPEAGLALLARLAAVPSFGAYQPFHAARADLLRRAGRSADAATSYDRAIELSRNGAERRFLARRRDEMTGTTDGSATPRAIGP
jgi:RNA polymerase sigma-70 factor (ECF subfamily)